MSPLRHIDQSNVLKDIYKLEHHVKEFLHIPNTLHDKTERLQSIEENETMFPEFNAFIDATEQEIPRPKNQRKRKTHYSGKKKRQTVKTQLTVNSKGVIIHKTAHARGSTHDYSLYKQSHPHLPSKVRQGFDLGYLGIKLDFPDLNCALPFKKKNPGKCTVAKAQEMSEDRRH
jgi:hypothetical protein